MKNSSIIYTLFLAAIITSCSPKNDEKQNEVAAPVAEKVPQKLSGDRTDNYYWMKLTDAQKTSEQKDEQTQKVLNYLTAENDFLKAKMGHTEALQDKIYNEIIGRIKQTDESVPYKDNGYWYYNRYEEGKEYPIYCRKKGSLEAAEEILLNVNDMAKGHDYYSISGLRVSEDNNLLAFGEDSVVADATQSMSRI